MEPYKKKFIEFMVQSNVLIFGDFTTKSGRKTPFFINTGNYTTGEQMEKLGEYYAEAVYNHFGKDVDVLFGPAYKGIPLVVTTAIALNRKFGIDVEVCFNRKEQKSHGEKGVFIGKKLQDGDRVIIIEDVTTAGTSIRETVPLLKTAAEIKLKGLVVSADRMEKGQTEKGALKELAQEYAMDTLAIVTLDEIVDHLSHEPINGKVILDAELLDRIEEYRNQFGCLR